MVWTKKHLCSNWRKTSRGQALLKRARLSSWVSINSFVGHGRFCLLLLYEHMPLMKPACKINLHLCVHVWVCAVFVFVFVRAKHTLSWFLSQVFGCNSSLTAVKALTHPRWNRFHVDRRVITAMRENPEGMRVWEKWMMRKEKWEEGRREGPEGEKQ